mmetsp:Transcript_20310/g.64899  ORF Transcript_20310/g.64899 Transcript_20310/m.64899 type:complete len:256 (+) Transcript_20310:89-856(+)
MSETIHWQVQAPGGSLELGVPVGAIGDVRLDPLRIGAPVVKVARVQAGGHLWPDGWLDLLLQKRVPVHVGEPLVVHHVRRGVLEAAQTLGRVGVQELLDKVLGGGAPERRGEHNLPTQNVFVDGELVVVLLVRERREPAQHLVDQNAQRPPVHRLVVARAVQDLGRQVVGRAAERVRASARVHVLLRQPKVGQLHGGARRRGGQQQVLRLEVGVNDAFCMQPPERGQDSPDVACGVRLRVGAAVDQPLEQFSTRY